MTVTDQTSEVWKVWRRANDEGYVSESIRRNVGEECYNLLVGGLAGVVVAVGGVMVCSAVGAGAGAALGGYFSAGNPAAIYASAELGANIGYTIATTALTVLGVAAVGVYLADHVWEIGRLAIAAYDIAVNQLPLLGGDAYDFLQKLAARWLAEAVGVFCGLLVFAIACLVIKRVAESKKGTTAAQAVRDLFESKLNSMCNGLVKWIVPRAQELRYKRRHASKIKFAVINGGVGPEQVSVIGKVLQFTRGFMPKIVSSSTRTVTCKSFREMNQVLTQNGFRLTNATPYGPKSGKQLFYERGNICCRVKTTGENMGPRANKPHISFGVNDGVSTAWYNDMAKVTAEGRLTFKLDTPVQRFNPTEQNGTPQRFIGIQGGLQKGDPNALQDAWAAKCHFNLPGNFSWVGLDGVLQTIRP